MKENLLFFGAMIVFAVVCLAVPGAIADREEFGDDGSKESKDTVNINNAKTAKNKEVS